MTHGSSDHIFTKYIDKFRHAVWDEANGTASRYDSERVYPPVRNVRGAFPHVLYIRMATESPNYVLNTYNGALIMLQVLCYEYR